MKTAVITLATGKASEWLAISQPSHQAYANKINATYVILDTATMPYPMGEKWRLSRIAESYDRIIYLDADVIVRPTAPDLFSVVPAGTVGVYNDLPDMAGTEWYHNEVAELQASQELPVRRLDHCYNTGLVVFDRDHRDIFAPPTKRFKAVFCAEQHLINIRLVERGYKVTPLTREIHWQWWSDPKKQHYSKAHFIHNSGQRDHNQRVADMKATAAEITSSVPASVPVQAGCSSCQKHRRQVRSTPQNS